MTSQTPIPPYITIEQPYVAGYTLGATQIGVFPMVIASNTRQTYYLRHTSLHREDYSIQAWFSRLPATAVIYFQNEIRYSVPIMKHRTRSFAIQDSAYTGTMKPDPSTMIIYLPVGTYYFNVENRTNDQNKFDIIYMETALT